MSRARRIAKEIQDVQADPASGIRLEFINESDISHLKGFFEGPTGTPYDGGHYAIDIEIPVCALLNFSHSIYACTLTISYLPE